MAPDPTAGEAAAAAILIPPFIRADPTLWFHMIESSFALSSPKAITESKTKYNYVVANLPPDTATVVRDIIMQPDPTDPYTNLKAKIIQRCGESKTEEIRRLLAGELLGDRKPSDLLREMKRRAENFKLEDTLLLELFNQALPSNVQTILASIDSLTCDKAAEIADKILAIQINPSLHSVQQAQGSSSSPSTHPCCDAELSQLRAEVKKIRKDIAFLRSDRKNNRFRHRSPSASAPRESQLCFYHDRYKEKAHKCVPPCNFSDEGKNMQSRK